MRLLGVVDGTIDRRDRAGWLTPPFDLAWAATPIAPTLPPDFLSALVAWWAAQPTLAGISPALYFGAAPAGPPWPSGDSYPYAVLSQAATRIGGQNTGRGYWEERVYQLAIVHPDLDTLVTLGDAAITALDGLVRAPLRFANGYQLGFWRETGDQLRKFPGHGKGGATLVHQQTYHYRARIGRARPS